MKKYIQKLFILLISLFVLTPMIVKADVSFLGFKADSDDLYIMEGDEVRFTLTCVNYKASPAYDSSFEKTDDKQLNTHGATISYDADVLDYVSIYYDESNFSDVISPEQSNIKVDTSIKGQLKYSFEKDFGSSYTYNVVFIFKVKEGCADSKVHKIGILNDEAHSKEFKVIKKDTEEKKVDKGNNDTNKEIINYISYGANAVLLIAVICLIVKRR